MEADLEVETSGEEIKEAMPIVEDELKKNNLILKKKKLKRFTKKIMAVFYRKNGLPGEETIREMTVASIQRLNMPIIKDELLKNSVVMEDRDIWYMTYKIMEALHNNGGVYCEEELRKKTQEYITKGLYKNYIGRAGTFNDDKIL
jgi:flagellar biosynthesis GTPase FlhF